MTESFKYDGLNRQVSRTVGGVTTYSVWDGWDLVQEYQTGGAVTANYLHGASGLVKNLTTSNYYYQDGSGSTSHLANSGGALLEWYRYDLQGTPVFYDAANVQITASNWGVRHLFTGQQWYSELGLYDLRNRFYSPDIGRFLQPDPIGFWGDRSNLYRYVGNNPVNWRDPSGLEVPGVKCSICNPNPEFPGYISNPPPPPEIASIPITDYGPGSGSPSGTSGISGGIGGGGITVSDGGFGVGGFGMGSGGRSFGSFASDHIGTSGSRGDLGSFDARTQTNIATLVPQVQALAVRHLTLAGAAGIDMRIIAGTRTYAEQDALYAQGRPGGPAGPIVTNARGGYSNHNFGIAYDVGIFRNGAYAAEGPEYDTVGRIGVGLGLEWGGNWIDMVDRPHFQFTAGLTLREIRARIAAGLPPIP